MRNSLIFSGRFQSLLFSLCSHFLPGSVVFLLSFPFTFFSPISLSAYCSQTTYSVSDCIFLTHPILMPSGGPSVAHASSSSLSLSFSRCPPLEAISYLPLPKHVPRAYHQDWVVSLMSSCNFSGYPQYFIPSHEREISKSFHFLFEHQ